MLVPYIATATAKTPTWWPARTMGESRIFTLFIGDAIAPEIEKVIHVSATSAPSGDGELILSDMFVAENNISLMVAGGQPLRVYTIQITTTMQNGEIFIWPVYHAILPGLPGYDIPLAPDPGFSSDTLDVDIARYNINKYNSGAVYA